jgi:SAM-dependent methyltransferase
MHAQALNFYQAELQNLPPLRVVEFGACDMNGSVRQVYPQAASWLGVDRQYGPGVDIVADAAVWRTDDRFDLCICAEVFEHTPDWRRIIDTAQAVLTGGGLFLASCARADRPPHSAVDGGHLREGEFYRNIIPALVELHLAPWSDSEVIEADGHFGNDDLYMRAIK